ncbi:hypothetical protein EVA_16957 [gut metagenome]|uniref:Uncharacterized protein n=1 Tax=gut metagenome TaxID=749906 RepID=J9FJ45_9ZZZZ
MKNKAWKTLSFVWRISYIGIKNTAESGNGKVISPVHFSKQKPKSD